MTRLPALLRRLAAPICLTCAPLWAAVPPPPDERSLRLDESTQSLKQEALALNRDLLDLEQAMLYPDPSRVNVYAAVKVPLFLLKRIEVTLDSGETTVYDYADSESKALLKKGFHRVLRANLGPGPHRLRVDFRGQFIDAKPGEPEIRGRLDTIVQKGLNELDLVLPVSRNTRLDKPGLAEVRSLESKGKRALRAVWLPEAESVVKEPDVFLPGSESDPRYKLALFLRHDKRFYSAISELMRIASNLNDDAVLPDEFYELLAECYLGFGMEDKAENLFRQLVESAPDPDKFLDARFQLAELNYQRGFLAEATDRLLRLRDRVPASQFSRWQTAIASVLLAQGRYNEAIEIIGQSSGDSLPPVMRYNMGIALINDGRITEGRNWLDRLGRLTPQDPTDLVIRDKANLSLGYHFLQNQQGGSAKPFFARVRTTGPYSNRALLGLGWSEIAPRGTAQARVDAPADGKPLATDALGSDRSVSALGVLMRPGFVDADVTKRMGLRPFKLEKGAVTEQDAINRALVPWTELISRDLMDPAVQEALLAIPYVLDRLQAYEQSLQLYQEAIGKLETVRKRLEEAQDSIRKGRMVETIVRRDLDSESGWQWRLRDLPDAPETYFLQTLLAEHRFQEPLKNYRDMRLVVRSFDFWKPRLEGFARTYANQPRAAVPVRLLIARAVQSGAGYGPMPMTLRLSSTLAAPGTFETPVGPDRNPAVLLWTADRPKTFRGIWERIPELRERIDALRPQISAGGQDLAKYLEEMAARELAGQKKQVERYLVEARFAVARIYDRQLKGMN